MPIKVIPSFTTTLWSGGTTTELFIYPPGSSFAKRDFLFRLSMATIHDDHSVFTPLPGIDRTLMLLEGRIKLVHEGHHTTELMPFDQDQFKGDWHTESFGTGTDFNLMTRGVLNSSVKLIEMQPNGQLEITATGNEMQFLFVFKGGVVIDGVKCREHEMAVISKDGCTIHSRESTQLVHVITGHN